MKWSSSYEIQRQIKEQEEYERRQAELNELIRNNPHNNDDRSICQQCFNWFCEIIFYFIILPLLIHLFYSVNILTFLIIFIVLLLTCLCLFINN